MEPADVEDAKQRYHFALPREDYERLPFYSALLALFENDETALRLLASVRVEQRLPVLVLATLHLAALRGHDVLAPIYADARRGELREPDVAARRVLEVLHAEPELVSDELWRATQTNEPGRSAVVQAVVREFESDAIDVLEVGASAGINLWFDQFPVRARDQRDPLTLVCDDRNDIDRTSALPSVVRRVGIDPHPLSLERGDDVRWLKACLWPEEGRRHRRLDAVVANHGRWPALSLVSGGVRERLVDTLDELSGERVLLVFNTWVAFYFTLEERAWYFEELTRRCRTGAVAWLSVESTLVEWPGVATDPAAHHRAASQIVLARAGSTPELWGWCHPHGRWLERAGPA